VGVETNELRPSLQPSHRFDNEWAFAKVEQSADVGKDAMPTVNALFYQPSAFKDRCDCDDVVATVGSVCGAYLRSDLRKGLDPPLEQALKITKERRFSPVEVPRSRSTQAWC